LNTPGAISLDVSSTGGAMIASALIELDAKKESPNTIQLL
jgi:hypothetical protein